MTRARASPTSQSAIGGRPNAARRASISSKWLFRYAIRAVSSIVADWSASVIGGLPAASRALLIFATRSDTAAVSGRNLIFCNCATKPCNISLCLSACCSASASLARASGSRPSPSCGRRSMGVPDVARSSCFALMSAICSLISLMAWLFLVVLAIANCVCRSRKCACSPPMPCMISPGVTLFPVGKVATILSTVSFSARWRSSSSRWGCSRGGAFFSASLRCARRS